MFNFPPLTPKRVGLGFIAVVLLVAALSIVVGSFGVHSSSQTIGFAPSMIAMDNAVSYRDSGLAMMMEAYEADEYYGEAGVASMPSSIAPLPPTPSTPPQGDAKIVKNGSLSLLVDRVDETAQAISTIRVNLKGQPGNASFSEYGNGGKRGDLTIWVPSDRFDEAMSAIKALALRVNNEKVSVKDVSAQYVDLESRLKNLKAAELQYQEIMKRSGKITEVLEVTRALNDTRSQIEQIQGQLNYLSRQVALSSITIHLSQEDVPSSVANEWRPLSVAKTALKGLLADLVSFINALIVIIIRLPLFILYVGLWVLFFWGAWKVGRVVYRKVMMATSTDHKDVV